MLLRLSLRILGVESCTLAEGEHLFEAESAIDDIYFVIDGLARFYYLTDTSWEFSKLAICMLEKLAIKKEQREADFLLLDATARYQKFLTQYADIKDKLANYHITSYLGITEVALSRIRRSLGLTKILT